MSKPLTPTPSNFRAEIARYRLKKSTVAAVIGMHPVTFNQIISGRREMTERSAHNIGFGINTEVGREIFRVDMSKGIVTMHIGRPKRQLTPSIFPLLPVDITHPRRRKREVAV